MPRWRLRGSAGEDGKTLVIAAFARKEDLKSHLELLSRAGLNPKTVTLGTLALAGLLARARNGAGGAHLVVDIDHGCTSMVLIDARHAARGADGRPRDASATTAMRRYQPAIAAVILGAVRQTLLAHGSDHEPPDLVLTGAAGITPAVREQIGTALAVPVHYVDEFDCSLVLRRQSHGTGRVCAVPRDAAWPRRRASRSNC